VAREIILDTETTGLSPEKGDRIVEIGAIEMVNKVLTSKQFHYYINPMRDMPTEAYRVHGISGEFLKDKPLFSDVVDEFLEFVNGATFVIHNAAFDIKFLNHELSLLQRVDIKLFELSEAIDTVAMARRLFPGMRANLDALCKKYQIDNSSRKLHGALKDAALLAEVYVELSGGRQGSFDVSMQNDKLATTTIARNAARANRHTVILQPTKEELEIHREFLAKILVNNC